MPESVPRPPTAVERALALVEHAPAEPNVDAGYLDLLDSRPQGNPGLVQSLMLSRTVPRIYERWWRPALGRIIKGPFGPTMADERRLAREFLQPSAGDVVLDVACGPGNFTRELAHAVGPEGLALGVDVSATMVARAVRDTHGTNVAYLRADAAKLPLPDASVDAVCCFAGLHLFPEPRRALEHMTRVLAPAGRIAILTAQQRGPAPLRAVTTAVGTAAGARMFGGDEITATLTSRGFAGVTHRVAGFLQLVGGHKAG